MSDYSSNAIPTSATLNMNSRLHVELHPLENDQILSRIFSFCSVEDLKSCRLVGSRLWLGASLNAWRKKAVLKIKSEVANNADNSGILLEHFQELYEDEEDPLRLRQKPFINLKLTGKHSEMDWIFEKYSSNIRYLCLREYEFPTLKSFLDTFILGLPNLVELKFSKQIRYRRHWREHLAQAVLTPDEAATVAGYPEHRHLKCFIIEMDRYYGVNAESPLKELLRKTPNLQDVRVISNGGSIRDRWDTGEAQEVMIAIGRNRREDSSKLEIRKLEVVSLLLRRRGFTDLRPRDFEALATIPLEQYTGAMVDVVHLKHFSSNLKFVSIFFTEEEAFSHGTRAISNTDGSNVGTEKVTLPLLKEFHGDGLPGQVFKNLNNMEAYNLETVVVDDVPSTNPRAWRSVRLPKIVAVNLNNPSFANVTTIELYKSCHWYWIDAEVFKSMSRSMPNVLHAKMPLTPKGFVELCRAWTQLVTLTLSQGYWRDDRIIDEVITGFKPNTEPPSDAERPPNITKLKNLQEFVHFSRLMLTDHSVNFGFLIMPKLKYLNIYAPRISDEARSELEKKVVVLELFNYSPADRDSPRPFHVP